MKPRVITYLLLLSAALAAYAITARRVPEMKAKVRELEQGFLDFLVGNAQDAFLKAVPAESSEVVLVEYKEEERAEHPAWPPGPLDYAILMKRLAPQEPSVVVFTEPLAAAGEADMQYISPLRTLLLPVPSVVLGFEVTTEAGQMTPEQSAFASTEMPSFPTRKGEADIATRFVRPTLLPERSLRTGGAETGISRIVPPTAPGAGGGEAGKQTLPFVVYDGERLVPSVAAQAVTRYRRTPFSALDVRFGIGARLILGDAHLVPLEKNGTMTLGQKPAVRKVSALELTSPILDEAEAKKTNEVLGKGKVLVVGIGQNAEAQARAVAFALAMPQLKRAPEWGAWAFAAWMALCCLRQWRYRRLKVLLFGVVLAVIAMVICVVTFQSSLWWWAPGPAVVVVVVSTLFCFLWPAPRKGEEKAGGPEAEAGGGEASGKPAA